MYLYMYRSGRTNAHVQKYYTQVSHGGQASTGMWRSFIFLRDKYHGGGTALSASTSALASAPGDGNGDGACADGALESERMHTREGASAGAGSADCQRHVPVRKLTIGLFSSPLQAARESPSPPPRYF